MSKADVTQLNAQLIVSGVLDFETVPVLSRQSAKLFKDKNSIIVNLEKVNNANSAGLALLVSWARLAKEQKIKISFINIPSQLRALIKVCRLESVLNI